MNRRSFLKTTSTGALAIGGASVLGFRPLAPSDQIRVGVIGVGSRGQYLLRRALRSPGVRAAALADVLDLRIAEARAVTEEATPAFTDYRRMLDAGGLDAVIVASPLALHEDHVLAALERGIPVYGEKSMAYTVDGATRIAEAAERTGTLFQVGHQLRYAPWTHEAVRLVREGEIGDVTHVYGYWHRNNNWRRRCPDTGEVGVCADPTLDRLINWRMYLESSRGLLAELGSHHIDVANWVFGARPTAVLGTGSIAFYDDGRETFDNVEVIYEYPGNRRMLFSSIIGNHHVGNQIWVYGTTGSLKITLSDATLFYEPYRENSAIPEGLDRVRVETSPTLGSEGDMPSENSGWVLDVEQAEPNQAAVADFFAAIRENRRPFADARVGWGSAVAVAHGHQAVRSGQRVDFPPQDQGLYPELPAGSAPEPVPPHGSG